MADPKPPEEPNEFGLLPCPFCGCRDIDPHEWADDKGGFGPGCPDCGAIHESAVAWNRRWRPITKP